MPYIIGNVSSANSSPVQTMQTLVWTAGTYKVLLAYDGPLGFNENWIVLITNWETTIRYHIKINGELSEEISPQ